MTYRRLLTEISAFLAGGVPVRLLEGGPSAYSGNRVCCVIISNIIAWYEQAGAEIMI